MEYKEPRKQSRQVQYGSMDGFVAPHQSRQPRQYIAAPRPPAALARPTAPAPKRSIPSTPEQPSLLHTTITSNTALSPHRPRHEPPSKTKRTKKKLVKRGILTTVVLFLAVGGLLGMKALNTVDKVFHGNVLSDATAAFNSTPLKGEASGHINILLAGDSSDDPGHEGAQLTDSILLVSIDTKNHSAFLLSIPRDLWVNIPGLDSYQKINAANEVTNFSAPGYPSGGMGQLEQIVKTQFGIPVDYYGLMDYGAFQDSVNAVGGVTINVQSPDPRGLYDPNVKLKLPNGQVTLDGAQALDLARARGDGFGSYGFPNSDFDRTAHQRQLFTAVAQKGKSLGVLTNPVKISNLFSALGNNFQTDLNLQNILRLIQVTKGISISSVQSYAFSSTLSSTTPSPILETYTDPASGEEALIPSAGIGNYGQMQQYYQQLTSSNPVVKEDPSIVLLNGSDAIGLAKKQQSILQSKGFDVPTITDADSEYPTTMIVDNSNGTKPNSLKALQAQYPGTTVTNNTSSAEATEAQGYTSDFVVILGQNWDSASSSSKPN